MYGDEAGITGLAGNRCGAASRPKASARTMRAAVVDTAGAIATVGRLCPNFAAK